MRAGEFACRSRRWHGEGTKDFPCIRFYSESEKSPRSSGAAANRIHTVQYIHLTKSRSSAYHTRPASPPHPSDNV